MLNPKNAFTRSKRIFRVKIIRVDDEKNVRYFIGKFFYDIRYTVFTVTDPLKDIPFLE